MSDDKKTITDTTRLAQENPMHVLAAMLGGVDRGIEEMEANGQRELVRAGGALLPIKGSENPAFAKMGITFGEKSDDLFVQAVLPQGWRVQQTDHSMWSDLLDAKGRKRAHIFYKAAFYDRDAHMTLTCRYVMRSDYDRDEKEREDGSVYVVEDTSTSLRVYVTKRYRYKHYEGSRWQANSAAEKDAAEWISKHYPNHTDPSAYWD